MAPGLQGIALTAGLAAWILVRANGIRRNGRESGVQTAWHREVL